MSRLIAALLILSSTAFSQEALEIMQEVQKRSRAGSQHYEGTLKVIDSKRKITQKQWVYERVGSHGESKAILRFTAPPEVRGVALLIVNHPERSSDQWMWTPSIARERRIAIQNRSTRFFGTDFSFEDLEERDVNQFDYELLGEEPCEGGACWKLEGRPKESKSSQYTHSLLWVRKDNYVIQRIESYNRSKLVRRLEYDDIEKVQGIWSARKIDVYDTGRDSHTILTLEQLQYNVPLDPQDFTLQALRRQS
ncbi:MAG: outer membrane lipoprotein-sorting protein [Bryobacteraceae bacterium]